MIVVFLGPPGSGKGTQAEVLREQYSFTHFDTGSQLRAEVASGSELGQRIAGFINAGQLVPLEVIKQLVVSFLRSTAAPRILFDGFPRNLEQAGVLDEALAELHQDLSYVVYLDADLDALLERIVNRRFCPQCGAIYNLISEPPLQSGRCDKCGSALTQRKDDTAEVFGTRLKVYLGETRPLVEMYRGRGLLHAVDALQGIDELTAQITRLIGVAGGAEA
jgi:adenylate kinase